MLISDFPCGFVFDVTRSDSKMFSYNTLEMVKNGFIMSGKYSGIRRTIMPCPVIVFANFEPDASSLSADRWCIHNVVQEASLSSQEADLPLPFPPRPPPVVDLESPKKEAPPEVSQEVAVREC